MLGIAIINYNKYEKTIECIKSIFKTAKAEYKIYLLDNASQNESLEVLQNEYENEPRVKLFSSKTNLGYANGNNLLLDEIKKDGCDYALISNNDIIFQNGSIDLLLEKIQNEDYLLIEPFIENIDGTTQICVKKSRPSYKEYMLFSTYLHNFVPKSKKREFALKQQPKTAGRVYWASGACFIADMKSFEEIGFFDKNTFLYFEEYIISEKAVKKGLKIGFEPNAKVIHFHGASTGGAASLFTRRANLESEMYFFTHYWMLNRLQLNFLRQIRCLEVLFTFTKNKKLKDALTYISQSKKIMKDSKERTNENQNL